MVESKPDAWLVQALVETITREVLAAYGDQAGELCPAGCAGECLANCPERVEHFLRAGVKRFSVEANVLTPEGIDAGLIEYTLRGDENHARLEAICRAARQQGVAAVAMEPSQVRKCAGYLKEGGTAISVRVGYPAGAHLLEMIVLETEASVQGGASEVELALNIPALKNGEGERGLGEVRAVTQVAKARGARLVKVAVDFSLLSLEEKVLASVLAQEGGGDYLKLEGGARLQDVALVQRAILAPEKDVREIDARLGMGINLKLGQGVENENVPTGIG